MTVARAPRPMPLKDVAEAFERFARANPSPRSDLEYTNTYTLLVAVVLSAQATDAGVNRATEPLFRASTNPAHKVRSKSGSGATPNPSAHTATRQTSIALPTPARGLRREGPRSANSSKACPGVGRKTANVVLNVAFGLPTMAVDTHIFRVSNRTGLAPGKDPLAVEKALLRRIPEPHRLHAHHWLILHGRYTCTARKPKCAACLIPDLCRFPERTA